MNSDDTVFGIIGAVIVLIVPAMMIWVAIYANVREKSYMKEQRQTGRDKQRMLDFMQIVMKEYYHDYIYAAGNYSIMVGRYRWYFYPYIVCFNERDIVVISYVMKGDGTLICRNVLPIDWGCMRLKYRIRDRGVKLIFQLGKTKMRMYVDRTVVSIGSKPEDVGTGDTPLGICQEQEVDQLIRYLPNYKKLGTAGR